MMSENTTFSEIMTKPDLDQQAEIWVWVMEMAKFLEDEHGYKRQTVLEGLLDATLDLAVKRPDERLFQKMNDTRRFYLLASQVTKRCLDQYPNYKDQRLAEEVYGKDMPSLRDAKNFGWEDGNL